MRYAQTGEVLTSVGPIAGGVEAVAENWRDEALEFDADMAQLTAMAAGLMRRARAWGDSERLDTMSHIMTACVNYQASPRPEVVQLQVIRQRLAE